MSHGRSSPMPSRAFANVSSSPSSAVARVRARALRSSRKRSISSGGVGHLRLQRHLGVVCVPEEHGLLVAQREDLVHQRRVVELARKRPPIRRARRVRLVELAAKLAIVGVGDDGVVAREVERQEVPLELLRARLLARLGLALIRHAAELRLVHHLLAVALHRIDEVLLELRLELREPQLDRGEAGLRGGWERDSREPEVALRVGDDLLPGGREGRVRGALREPLVGVKEPLVLRQLERVHGELRQAGVERLAPLRGARDAEEVRDGAPDARHAIARLLDRADERLPARVPTWLVGFGEQGVESNAALGEHGVDRGLGVVRPDAFERREALESGRGGRNKGIFHGFRGEHCVRDPALLRPPSRPEIARAPESIPASLLGHIRAKHGPRTRSSQNQGSRSSNSGAAAKPQSHKERRGEERRRGEKKGITGRAEGRKNFGENRGQCAR